MCEANNVNKNTNNNTNAQAPVPAPKKCTFWKVTGLILGTVASAALGAAGGYYYAKHSGSAANNTEAFK